MLTAEPIFTAEKRKELIGAKSAKMIRQGVYEVGILIGAVLLTDNVAKFGLGPEYTRHIESIGLVIAGYLWIGMIWSWHRDSKSIDRLEKGLDREELEREMGRTLTKDELKNYGLH